MNTPLETKHADRIQHIIDNKTKPPGSLGQLEAVAHQLALIQSQGKTEAEEKIQLKQPTMLVFAGDHGIAAEGVSIAPSEVTQQMVMNFLSGGAAINCFCRVNDIELRVIDSGMLNPLENPAQFDLSDYYHQQRLGAGTSNFAAQAAMSPEQVSEGLALGGKIVHQCIDNGCDLMMFGEMGIGNTSSAAALLAAVTQQPVEACVGLGTGINSAQLDKKMALISQALERSAQVRSSGDMQAALSELGGFEIVQMVGGFIAANERNVPVLVDGFIVSVAALVAARIAPKFRETMIFAHRSEESGHRIALEALEAKPLLDLGLRLGEGTGAALAYPLLQAAVEFYNNMASFESAGVTV